MARAAAYLPSTCYIAATATPPPHLPSPPLPTHSVAITWNNLDCGCRVWDLACLVPLAPLRASPPAPYLPSVRNGMPGRFWMTHHGTPSSMQRPRALPPYSPSTRGMALCDGGGRPCHLDLNAFAQRPLTANLLAANALQRLQHCASWNHWTFSAACRHS